MNRLILAAGAVALAASVAPAPPAAAQIQGLEIVVPAAPGGGWDQTGRAMQSALQEAGLASGIQVVNIPGAGGNTTSVGSLSWAFSRAATNALSMASGARRSV